MRRSHERRTARAWRAAGHYRARAMVGDAMITGLLAWLFDALRLRRQPAGEAFEWNAELAAASRARAEAATRWTWEEWREELGTDFWTDEREDVA